jgi:predicted nucleic acid-binding Zn ribbon protein
MERVVAKASHSAKYNSSIEIYLLLRTLHGDAWPPGCVFCSDECRRLDKAERTRTKREKYCTQARTFHILMFESKLASNV